MPGSGFFMQMFNDCPSYRQTVKSRRTAANFIKNDKRAFIRLIQNAGGFDHLNHKGRTAARQIVRSADTGKILSITPICALLQGTKEPICAITAMMAFCRRKVDLPAMFGPVSSQISELSSLRQQSLPTKAPAWSRSIASSTTGWRPSATSKTRELSRTGRQ